MAKLLFLSAFFAVAVLAQQPHDEVVPEVLAAPPAAPPDADAAADGDVAPADASFAQNKAFVIGLLQSGKKKDQCGDMSKTLSDQVKADVKAQQDQLDAMPKGEAECDNEGQDLVSAAQGNYDDALGDQTKKQNALTTAQTAPVNFGSFKYNELTEGQCGNFFSMTSYTDAKAAVKLATDNLSTAKSKVGSTKDALANAKSEAVKLVKECRCNAKKLIEKTLSEMNSGVKEANTAAWKKAAHILCVLDGNPEDKCPVPTLPTVKAVTLSEKVNSACSTVKIVRRDDFKSGGSWPGRKFELAIMKPDKFGSNDESKYKKLCTDNGYVVVGCGSTTYNCEGHRGKGNCVSMPAGWGCNMMSNLRSKLGFDKRVMAYCTGSGSGCSHPLYTNAPQGSDYPGSHAQVYAVCGKYI